MILLSRRFYIDNFYIIFMVLAFLSFSINFPDVFRNLLWTIIFLCSYRLIKPRCLEDQIILLYCFLGLLSIIGYLFNPYPIDFFIKISLNSYLPILFYFIGRTDKGVFTNFYKLSLFAFVVCFCIGFYWLIFDTSWYMSKFLARGTMSEAYNETTFQYSRFASFLDSYHTANLGVVAMCLSIGLSSYFANTKKQFLRIIPFLALLISLITVLLSRQRVALFIGIAILVSFFYKKGGRNKILTLMFLALIILLVVCLLVSFSDETMLFQITNIFTEQSSAESLMAGRSSQWINVIEHHRNIIFGHGLGGGGHLANAVGIMPNVTDGSYFKIFLETGIFSISVFIFMIVHCLRISIMQKRFFDIEPMIVFFYMFSFIGANIIDFPYIMPPFWYAIGRIVSTKYNKIRYE